MKIYQVDIKETLYMTVEVEAETPLKAEKLIS